MAGKEYEIVNQPGYTIDYTQHNLIQLIRDGYGVYNENAQEEPLTQVQSYEYRNADKVYFAFNQNGSEVGSLSIGLKPNIENDPFWTTLQALLNETLDINFTACEMYGIVVHPKVRREGIATRLLSEMIEDINPQVIFGQTNVPEIVFLRSGVAKMYSFRTFYGFRETTPSLDYKKASDAKPFAYASFIAQEAKPNESGIYTISTHILPSSIPNTNNFPLQIQKAFEPVQKAQRAIGKEQTAVTSLVSVQDRLLRRLYE